MIPALARSAYFAIQRLRREPIAEALDDVRRRDRLSRDELLAHQAQLQLEQLRFARAHVPYYRRVLAPLAAAIDGARDWDAVAAIVRALPVIEKGTVMDRPAELTADNASELPTHLDKTSGSSGTPVIFPCDQRAWAYRHAITYAGMEAFGVKIGEPYALFFGLHWNRRARAQVALRDRIFNRTRISAYEIGPDKLAEHFAAIRRRRPTHFQGYPSAVYDFCVLCRDAGLDLRELRLKAIFLTSEPLRPHQRELIDEVTGSRCVNVYGSAEGGLNAFECPAGSLHTTPVATWIDVRGGGARGEAIVTDLMLRAFPMIRYALEDEIVLSSRTCNCGRAQPLLDAIEGRAGIPITLPNGRVINANLPSYIFKPLASLGVIRRYRFVQHGKLDLELLLVVAAGFQDEHLDIVKRETRAAFGDDVAVRITLVAEMPHLPNAKHRDYVYVEE